MATMSEHITKPPRLLTAIHQYFKLHYQARIKNKFLRRLELAKQEWDRASDAERIAACMKKPEAVSICILVGREMWNTETAATRKEMEDLARERHELELQEWKSMQEKPKTPQQFHQ